ncbi:MAG: recombination-associated protein RdgC [Betaproteobacteria bacterium]|nr:recombination-associated protein RdgC [Betaproteobacteria bacterium]
MLLKNLVLYRLPADWAVDAEQLQRHLANQSLQPCGGFQMESRGWTWPHEDGVFLYQQARQWLLALGVEQKLLPASVIRQEAQDRAAVIEREQGHPVGRKQMRDLRDQVTNELLPRALARRRITHAWIDAGQRLLAVNAVGDAKVEQFMEALRRADDDMQALRLETQRSPAAAMAEWLVQGEAPGAFTIDQDLELRAADAGKATVRYARHPLEGKEIRDHIAAGKTVVRLGLTWNDKISFVLTEHLQIKRIVVLNVIRQESEAGVDDEQEQFELDFALMTGELALMIGDLVKALDGEKKPE